ncbi:type IV pilin protein [Massilia sp. DWR3-1-1]|uniref:type IV pilin protein n=1 Tax=Massilia sp. DWR3-1-1 TaxID=2804559 RepID=UPI003CF0C4FC
MPTHSQPPLRHPPLPVRFPPALQRRGFTLVELLIVMTIISILSSIAYPSYAAHVLRARRLEGKVALVEAMHLQEKLYSRSNSYAAWSADQPAAPAAGAFKWWSGVGAAGSAYELHAQPCGDASLAQCIEMVATPGTAMVDGGFRDPDCGALSLRSTGEQRAASGNARCWP